MNIDEELASIGALNECMTFLGLSRRQGEQQTVAAKIRRSGQSVLPGTVDVTFELLDMSNGCEINCNPEILKGYDIQFGNFRPWFQAFSFDSDDKELRIISESTPKKYDFSFCF